MILFPGIARPARMLFGVASACVAGLLIATSILRWQPALIALVGAGLPVVFVAYALATGAVARLRAPVVALIAGVAAALGIAWALGADAAIERGSQDALGIPPSTAAVVVTALAIPVTFLLGLLAAVVVVRIGRPGSREPLTGYLVGVLSSAGFIAASTLTRLAPSLVVDVDTQITRTAAYLAVAAMVQGIAIPVTATAVAGAVGATVWSIRRADRPRRFAMTSPAPSVTFAVAAYVALGVLDIAAPPTGVEMAAYAALAVLSLAFLRVVLRATLPAETPTPARPVVPLAAAMAGTLAVLTAGAAGLAVALKPAQAQYVCPPDCGTPPIAAPVSTNPRFTADSGEFSVSYPGAGTAYEATFEDNGVVLELVAGDGGVLRLFGEPALGRSAREICEQLIEERYRDATFAYEIPNAMVGYQLGYGEVADVYPESSVGGDDRARILVMVAVKNDYALVAAGAGPFQEFGPDFGSGHPSGANFLLALDMGKYVNSFQWRGDPPR